MPNIFGLRKGLYQPKWEAVSPGLLNGGYVMVSPDLTSVWQEVMCASNNTMRASNEDAWIQLPASGMSTSGGSASGIWHPHGPTGTTSAATATTITTNLTSVRKLDGITIRLTGGLGAGQERVVTSSTVGSNTVITVPAWTVQPDATTTWLLLSGRYYVLSYYSENLFKYYDPVLGSWSAALTSPSARGASSGTALAATCFTCFLVNQAVSSATSTTLTTTGKTWAINQWKNFQVRITSGAGAGQVRAITANTAEELTVPAWSATPDNSSVYVIEGAEDYIYLVGDSSATIRRYSRSANTWTNLANRASIAEAGTTLNHIDRDPAPYWSDESNFLNGRYLYSLRGSPGAGSSVIDAYDITADSWSVVSYVPTITIFGYGGGAHYVNGALYIQGAYDAIGTRFPWYRFRPGAATLEPITEARIAAALVTAAPGPRSYATSQVVDGKTFFFLYQSNVVANLPTADLRLQETD